MHDMNQLQVLEQRIVCLEARERSRLRIAKALVAVVAVGSLVAGVQEARAWGGCNQFLSTYGLKTFCAGDPALATDINSNFQVLAKGLEAKVGKISDAKVTISGGTATLTGKLTANGGLTVTGDAASSGTVSGFKGTFGSGSSGVTMLGGGNTAGNLHIDATNGATFLNYYAGKGVYFGNGASGIAASVDSAGNLSAKNVSANGTVSATALTATKIELPAANLLPGEAGYHPMYGKSYTGCTAGDGAIGYNVINGYANICVCKGVTWHCMYHTAN
jgi:hypothetical protein